jgi:very-short-patch-repair endonuclease
MARKILSAVSLKSETGGELEICTVIANPYFTGYMCPPHKQRRLYLRVRDLARQLRKPETQAEAFFWTRVRNRKLNGLKFNRQFIIQCPLESEFTKYYIADFYCHELRLIVEVDGPIHTDQTDLDLVRTEHMHEQGYRVLRFLECRSPWRLGQCGEADFRTHP